MRLLLAIDRASALRFAALHGETFTALVPDQKAQGLPDSLVLRTADGRLLVRSAAVLDALRTVGGPWRAVALALRLVPRGLADRLYDAVARMRHRLFRRPAEACPVPPGPLRERFLP